MRGLGNTWRARYGSRAGIQIRDRHGGVGPVTRRTTVWDTGDLGEGVFETAWRYYFPGKKIPSEPLKTGFYSEGGYIYYYTAGSVGISIVLSPRSASAVPLAKGSPAWKAVMRQIESGVASPISAGEVKAARAAFRLPVAPLPAPRERSVALPSEPVESVYPALLDRLPSWAPVAAAGGVAILLALLLIPKKQNAPAA